MAYNSFLSWYHQQGKTEAPVSVPEPVGRERRDFDLKSAEAQRLFVWGLSSENSEIVVNDDSILSSTPFFGAMRYISEGIAMLDRKVRARNGNRYFDDYEHPISFLFQRRPHPYYTWFDLITSWVCNAMLGNGYIRIHWDELSGRPSMLEHIPSRYCYPEFDARGFLWFRISGEINGVSVNALLPHTDILHLKGLTLDGILGAKTSIIHKTAIGSSLAADLYTQSVFEKGAFPSIAIKTDETLDSTEVAIMEQNVASRIGGVKNSGRPLVLDNGKEVQYLQWSPLDVALDSVKHLTVEQVSQITKVPRDLLALDTHGTYGAAIQRSKDFYVHCLQPWVEKIEEEFSTKLFTELETALGTHSFGFDPSLYLSMSPKEQIEMLSIGIKSSQITPNEAREEHGRDPLPGGDTLYGDINTLPLEQLVEVALAKYLSSVGEKAKDQQQTREETGQNNIDNEQETQPAQ